MGIWVNDPQKGRSQFSRGSSLQSHSLLSQVYCPIVGASVNASSQFMNLDMKKISTNLKIYSNHLYRIHMVTINCHIFNGVIPIFI